MIKNNAKSWGGDQNLRNLGKTVAAATKLLEAEDEEEYLVMGEAKLFVIIVETGTFFYRLH